MKSKVTGSLFWDFILGFFVVGIAAVGIVAFIRTTLTDVENQRPTIAPPPAVSMQSPNAEEERFYV